MVCRGGRFLSLEEKEWEQNKNTQLVIYGGKITQAKSELTLIANGFENCVIY
jgi:hypothetical protein